MNNLYITADEIGTETGGGLVTFHESEALKTLGPCEILSRGAPFVSTGQGEPWGFDDSCAACLTRDWISNPACSGYISFPDNRLFPQGKIAHFYAGTFSKTVTELKARGTKVSYTAAAHDVEISRKEHEILGIPYNYPHITDPKLWERYIRGYLEADVLICPSTHSANVMRGFGAKQRIEILPHGCNIPENIAPFPKTFTVGYLGSYGPDKGIRHLLKAWRELDIKDGLLVLAGRDSSSPWVNHLIERFGGGNIMQLGWMKNPSTFYNNISLLVQPSASEGFGCEILEAMAHGRPVIASTNSGGPDVLPWGSCFGPGENMLATKIKWYYNGDSSLEGDGEENRYNAEKFTWPKIRQRYVDVWRSLL